MSSASTSAHSTVSQGEANNDLSYKERLDKAAEKVKNSHNNNSNGGGLVNQVVEKVSQYVPAVGKALGQEQKKNTPAQSLEPKVPGPPERPVHDVQIEEFVRDQHRSKPEDGAVAGQ